MRRFSANLGFLWTDRAAPDAVRAAKAADFDAVEAHWPYETPPETLKAALDETGLPLLGLNTRRGDPQRGEFGLCALPGREQEARASIDEAAAYAARTDAAAIHVMAGFSGGPRAEDAFLDALRYASEAAPGRTILIEPLNHYDAPGYFLSTTSHAAALLRELGAPNVKLMFDCYHVQAMEGDVTRRIERLAPLIGHIQIAAAPDRGAPDRGELNYAHVLDMLDALGWSAPIGAEYKPGGETDASLGWMARLRG